jgi:hypothetical protein
MEWDKIISFVLAIILAVGGAYVVVKVAIAELKKDILHLTTRLETEIGQKDKMEETHTKAMDEVRGDVKAIFKTLTAIQVSQAKAEGRDEVLEVVKDAIQVISKKK